MTAIPMSTVSHKNSFSNEELLACGRGEMFGAGNAQLPAPPDVAVRPDRHHQRRRAAPTARASMEAEFDINPGLWFFKCHFLGDPVMPGCLGVDAMWQLVGFYLGWIGGKGRGRALGCSEVKFAGEVTPNIKAGHL